MHALRTQITLLFLYDHDHDKIIMRTLKSSMK